MTADERLLRLLGGEALAELRQRLRLRFEGSEPASFRLERLRPAEHAALAQLQGRAAHAAAASMRVDVAVIDELLQRAGVAPSLRAALEALDGPIVDHAAERDALQAAWRQLIDGCEHPALAGMLRTTAGTGLLKRLAAIEETKSRSRGLAAASAEERDLSRPAGMAPVSLAGHWLRGAESVLQQLPARGLTRARLAASALGDAHGLDTGRPVATLVLSALRHQAMRPATFDDAALEAEPGAADEGQAGTSGEASTRDLWAAAGVLVNELARPVLVLNLPGIGVAGEPNYLSLRRLLRTPPDWPLAGATVFVCENPNLLAIAADHLGPACAPLVCTEGMPAAAQRTLLEQLAGAGAVLRYHGDFDWPGLRIANYLVRERGVAPWRLGAADYLAACRSAGPLGRALQGAPVEAAWDAGLAAAMRDQCLAIDEEAVAGVMLSDLARDAPIRP